MKLWDAMTGRLVRTFTGHSSWVQAVAEDAPVADKLDRGDQVWIRVEDGAWSLVERHGVEIGYVPSEALLPLKR
jgi:hypothetical protein